MNDTLLEVKDLHVQYDTDDAVVYALNGVDLSIQKGEILGLVGETGAGKTTLALSLLKLLPAKIGKITKGSIRFDDIDIIKAKKGEMMRLRGSRISMIFQDPMSSLNPLKTIESQIIEVLDLHFPAVSKAQKNAKVDEVLKLVGIQSSRKKEYPNQFSGGMKQRIGIAMALISEPELLLADEPTTALDVTIQAQILRLMKELKDQFGSAMILITHDLGVVAEFCERVAVIYSGQIVEQGTVEDVFSRENIHPYTEGLFNSIPDLEHDMDRLIPIEGSMPDSTATSVGCKFADRCPYCRERCKREEPTLYAVGETHLARCFRYEGKEVISNG